MTTMTKSERSDLAALIRKRERVMKTATAQRAAELLADFERQLGTIYSFDDDKVWRDARNMAKEVVEDAKVKIAARVAELGIPKEFAPGIEMDWYGRNENAAKDRRAEFRKMAVTRIDAMQKGAKTDIEKYSLEAQTALVSEGLTTEAAQKFLTDMPPVETLMPALDASKIKGLIESD